MIFQVARNINHADRICIISFHDVRWQSIESDSVLSIDFLVLKSVLFRDLQQTSQTSPQLITLFRSYHLAPKALETEGESDRESNGAIELVPSLHVTANLKSNESKLRSQIGHHCLTV